MKLRDYQQDCVDTIQKEFINRQSQLIQLPTGAGKTVILWHYLKASGLKSLIIAPTRELTDQLYDTGCEVLGSEDIYLKRRSDFRKCRHLITTMQGLTWIVKRDNAHKLDFDVFIIDEAHRSYSKSYLGFIERYIKDTDKKCLGLTATPERLDGKNLLDIFEKVTFSRTLIDLIRKDYLTDIMCYKVNTDIKMENVTYRMGEFSSASLRQLDTPKRNGIILDIVKNKIGNKKTLIFCLSVDHARAVSKILNQNGFKASSVSGDMPKLKRKETIKRFKNGEIQFLTNCQLLTEGFDEPSIEVLILATPTRSKALYCQMIGRGVRPYKDKEFCLVYDMNDQNFNITSFNSLGNIDDNEKLVPDETGERFSEMFYEFENISGLEKSAYELEKHELVKISYFDDEPALDHQMKLIHEYGIPFYPDITIHQAAYLLWKHRTIKEFINGIDTKSYWKKWLYNFQGSYS